jgi:hypothetical protein
VLPTKFQFIWPSSFRGEDFLEINQSKIFSFETAWPNESKLGRKHPWKVIYKECAFSSHPLISRTFQGCFLPSFDSFGQAFSEEKIF